MEFVGVEDTPKRRRFKHILPIITMLTVDETITCVAKQEEGKWGSTDSRFKMKTLRMDLRAIEFYQLIKP